MRIYARRALPVRTAASVCWCPQTRRTACGRAWLGRLPACRPLAKRGSPRSRRRCHRPECDAGADRGRERSITGRPTDAAVVPDVERAPVLPGLLSFPAACRFQPQSFRRSARWPGPPGRAHCWLVCRLPSPPPTKRLLRRTPGPGTFTSRFPERRGPSTRSPM